MAGKTGLTGETVKEYLGKFTNTSNLCLARIIYRDNPELFMSVEHARAIIRYYRGSKGKQNRSELKDRRYVRKFVSYTFEP